MADELLTCANCGHTQASGAFCEACGTKLGPVVATPAAAAAAAPASEPAPAAAPVAVAAPTTEPASAPAAAPAAAAMASTPPPAATTPPPPPPPVYAPAPQVDYADMTGKSFWERFFDFSFKEFITPSVIKVLFIVLMVVIGLAMLAMIINGFVMFGALGVIWLIVAIVWGFVSLLFSRVFLELVMVFFNIHDNTRKLSDKK